MSAVKQSHQQQHDVYPQQKTVDLTAQERKALNMVWAEDHHSPKNVVAERRDVAHCAVLGYN